MAFGGTVLWCHCCQSSPVSEAEDISLLTGFPQCTQSCPIPMRPLCQQGANTNVQRMVMESTWGDYFLTSPMTLSLLLSPLGITFCWDLLSPAAQQLSFPASLCLAALFLLLSVADFLWYASHNWMKSVNKTILSFVSWFKRSPTTIYMPWVLSCRGLNFTHAEIRYSNPRQPSKDLTLPPYELIWAPKALSSPRTLLNDSIHGLSNPSFTSLGPGKEISIWNLNILS